MKMLIWKEIRERQWVPVAFGAMLTVWMLMTLPLMVRSPSHYLTAASYLLSLLILLTGFSACGAIGGEVNRGTLAFLDSLPTGRPRLWAAKLLGSLLIVAVSAGALWLVFIVGANLCKLFHILAFGVGIPPPRHIPGLWWWLTFSCLLTCYIYAVCFFFSTLCDRPITTGVLAVVFGVPPVGIYLAVGHATMHDRAIVYFGITMAIGTILALLAASYITFCKGDTLRTPRRFGLSAAVIAPWLVICFIALGVYATVAAARSGAIFGMGSRNFDPYHQQFHTVRQVSAAGITSLQTDVDRGDIRIDTQPAGSPNIIVIARRNVHGTTSGDIARFASQCRLEMDRQGGKLVIRDVVPDDRTGIGDSSVDVTLLVPPGLAASSISDACGEIRMNGRFGNTNVNSSLGAVRLSGDYGNLAVHNTCGQVDFLDGSARDISISSSLGAVRLVDIGCLGDTCAIDDSCGQANLSLLHMPKSGLKVSCSMGAIKARLPADMKATVDLSADVGSISSDFPITLGEDSSAGPSQHMSGTINGGGVSVKLHSSTGSVALRRG